MIRAIADATSEPQSEHDTQDRVVNPPRAQSGDDVFQAGRSNYTLRRVQNIEFDVAIKATTETAGGGKAGIKVFSAGVGAGAEKSSSSEQVSRVKFSVPLTLKPSTHEVKNLAVKRREKDEYETVIAEANTESEYD